MGVLRFSLLIAVSFTLLWVMEPHLHRQAPWTRGGSSSLSPEDSGASISDSAKRLLFWFLETGPINTRVSSVPHGGWGCTLEPVLTSPALVHPWARASPRRGLPSPSTPRSRLRRWSPSRRPRLLRLSFGTCPPPLEVLPEASPFSERRLKFRRVLDSPRPGLQQESVVQVCQFC